MDDKDLHIRYTKGTGPGGQHKNKVETCVIVTHIPTGFQVRCQDTRSKIKNLEIAKERLEEKIKREEEKILQDKKNSRRKHLIKNPKVVRTYNYARNEVYDHRTGKKYNLKKFMDGKIDLSEN